MTAAELFANYGMVITEFLVELYVFYGMLVHRLERRPRFVLRAILSALGVFALAIPISAFYTAFGGTVWGRTIVYMLLFGLVFAQGLLLFDAPIWTVLFCATAAYAAQNLVYNIYLFQYFFGKLAGAYDFSPDATGIALYRLMYYLIFAALATAMWFIALGKMSKKLALARLNYRIFAVVLVILAVTVVLCSMADLFFEEAGMGVEVYRISFSTLFALRQTDSAMSAVCCVTIMLLMYKTLEERDLAREVEQLQHAVRQSELQYHISEDTIKLINLKCHDMKYKLDAAINGSGVSPDTFDDLRRSIAIYDSNIETGNKLLNVLFTEKCLYCEQHDIKLTCMIDGARLGFMGDGDLYCLFGNIADNALEAVRKIKDHERRVISITVRAEHDMVVVQAENFFAGKLAIENGLPVTTKADKAYHGFGMSSMRLITQRYGGEMHVDVTDDKVFRLTILFPHADGNADKVQSE